MIWSWVKPFANEVAASEATEIVIDYMLTVRVC